MPPGGKLTIETANVELDDVYVRGLAALRLTLGATYVMLAVTDTGCRYGCRDASLTLSNRFLLRRNSEKGTGLGLATVFGIVKQSGGNI